MAMIYADCTSGQRSDMNVTCQRNIDLKRLWIFILISRRENNPMFVCESVQK